MKKSKEELEQNIAFEIQLTHALNTSSDSVPGRTILCTYFLNEEKGLQE